MFCLHCGHALADGATLCPNCGKKPAFSASPVSIAAHPPVHTPTPPALSPQTPPLPPPGSPAHFPQTPPPMSLMPDGQHAQADPVIEALWRALAEQRDRHEYELAQLRRELASRPVGAVALTPVPGVLAPAPLDHEGEPPEHKKKHFRISTALIFTLFLLSLCGLTWFLYKLVNSRPVLLYQNVSILATTLTVIGTFYLAYDLLGRQNGPLQWVSSFVTSGLLGGMVAEPIILLLGSDSAFIGTAVQTLLVSALQGAFAGITFGITRRTYQNGAFSWRRALLGVVLGIAFWTVFARIFIPFTRIPLRIILVLLACGASTGLLVGGFHPFFQGKVTPEEQRPKVFSWAHFLKASLIFVVFWTIWMIVILGKQGTPIIAGIVLFGIFSLTGIAPSGFARYVFWWLNHLPPKVLGAVGLILTLVGTLLTLIQPISEVLAALSQPK